MKIQLILSSILYGFLGVFFTGIVLVNFARVQVFEGDGVVLLCGAIAFIFLATAVINLIDLIKIKEANEKFDEVCNKVLGYKDEILQLQNEINEKKSFYENKLSVQENQAAKNPTDWVKELPLGILKFDRSGNFIEELTSICERFYGKDFFEKNMISQLYLDEEQQAYFKKWLEILEVNPMPMNHLADLLPSDVELPNPIQRKRGKTKPINLRYKFCPIGESGKGPVDEVMVFIQDVSKEVSATKTLSIKEGRLEFILNILRDRNRYINYLENCFDCIDKIEDICNNFFDGNPHEKVNSAFRLVHTVRGNSAAFGVKSLRDVGDVLEKILLEGRDGERELDADYEKDLKEKMPLLRAGLVEHLKQTETTFNEVFDPSRAGNRTFNVPSSYLDEFESVLSKVEDEDFRIKLIRKLKEIYLVPVRKMLLQYTDTVKQLAERQNKLLSPLVINGGDTLINEKEMQSFFNIFIHLVLNCVDHGIEKPVERLEKGKIEEAIVRIRTQADDEGLYLSIEDDGRGLNIDEIVKRALQKNMVTDMQLKSMTDEDKLNLIFKEGFSTTRKITTISGRGMGMSAVMHEVKALKGTIKVSTVYGKGTLFTIFLPVEAF